MQLRNTLILAAVFAALGAYLYLVELERSPDASTVGVLVDIDSAAVTRVELEHPGRQVVVERRDGEWRMVEPVDAPADQRNVENLIDAVEAVEISRTLDSVETLATFGLDAPSATVRLGTAAEIVAEVRVGKKAPVGNSAYVQRDGDSSVHLVDASFVQRIDKTAADLRDKRVVVFEADAVRSVTIEGTAGTVTLSKDDGLWTITAPANYDADQANAGAVVSALRSMRATEFVDETSDHLERYGLDDATRSVTVEIENAPAVQLRIGTVRDGKLRVQSSLRPTVYAVPSWVGDSLDRDLSYLRDKTISRFAAEDAVFVRITEADGELSLELAARGWVDSTGDQVIDGAAVEALVRAMTSLSGFEIVADAVDALAPYGLDPPTRTIRVRDADSVEIAAVSIGTHAADGAATEYAATRPGAATVFHLREAVYRPLAGSLAASETPVDESDGP